MDCGSNYCCFCLTWDVTDKKTFKDCVVYRIENNEGEIGEPLSSSPECISLTPSSERNNHGPCSIHVSTSSGVGNMLISSLDVVCDARRMELFGSKDDYVTTVTGQAVDLEESGEEAKEQKLFLIQHTFEKPVKSCRIQLVSLVTPSCVSIYGFHVTVTQAPAVREPPFLDMSPNIDVAQVREILGEGNGQIPENAKNIMAAMEASQQNRQASLGTMQQMFSTMMAGVPQSGQASGTIPNSAPAPSMPQFLSSMMSLYSSGQQTTPAFSGQLPHGQSMPTCTNNVTCTQRNEDKLKTGININSDPNNTETTTNLAQPNLNLCSDFKALNIDKHPTSTSNLTASNLASSRDMRTQLPPGGTIPASQDQTPPPVLSQGATRAEQTLGNPMMLSMLASSFESRLEAVMRESERRICSVLTERIAQSESRILAAVEEKLRSLECDNVCKEEDASKHFERSHLNVLDGGNLNKQNDAVECESDAKCDTSESVAYLTPECD